MKYNLLNMSTLLADNTAGTWYNNQTWSQVARTDSPLISSHDLINFHLRASTLEYDLEQAFCFKIVHIPKYTELRDGEDGGQSFFILKDLKSWDEIDGETVRASCDQVMPRLHRVVRQKGGYIE